MAITEELLDQLIKDYKKPEDLIGENGLLKQLTNITSRTSNMWVVQEAAKDAAPHTPALAVQIQT